jgi:MauM/NapG family ferredoxin protein
MKNFRRVSQALFLLLFFFLFFETESKGTDTLGYPVKIFLDFDPLVFVTTALSAHALSSVFFLSLIVVIITVVFGRVFCGWVCPLGTLNNMAGSVRKEAYRKRIGWFRTKYFILLFLLASSLFSLQLTGIVDPISLLIRSLSVGVNPFFNYGTRAVFDAVYELHPPAVVDVSEAIYSGLKKSVLSFTQPYYRQSTFIGLLFLAVLGLNLVEKRFWCRYLCPLGALLGILSRRSPVKRSVSEECNSCGACARVCQGNASPDGEWAWKATECYSCRNCDDACPRNAVSFGFRKKTSSPSLDLGRREVLASVLSGIIAVPLLRQVPLTSTGHYNPSLIRPPGALDEKDFLRRCIKCGECMKVCITNGLQPEFLESGPEGIWSPVLVPGLGYCEYRCTLCGQVCPTGAIRKLDLEEKAKIKIGLAMIDKSRCLPYAHGTPCIVCEEVCPTPKKAVWFEPSKVRNRNGKEVEVQQPRVDLELCIGCGICEAKCPLIGAAAIRVTSIGESRSRGHRLLL